jgi:hypothetical protein
VRVHRLALIVLVALLCGAFYMAGVWVGAGKTTCVFSEPGVIVCGQGTTPPPVPTKQPAKDDQPA